MEAAIKKLEQMRADLDVIIAELKSTAALGDRIHKAQDSVPKEKIGG